MYTNKKDDTNQQRLPKTNFDIRGTFITHTLG